jgi:hypothetical protein
MPIRRTVTEVARNFSDYIGRVLFRRERFVLLRGNRPVAELRPVDVGVPLADLPGRAELHTLPINDPWQR